jgi:hypothetical protein
MTGDGERLRLGSTFGESTELSRLSNQTQTVRPDDRKAAHAIAESRGDMTTEDAAERKSGNVQIEEPWKHQLKSFDDDAGQSFRGMRLGRRSRLAQTRQIWCCYGESS